MKIRPGSEGVIWLLERSDYMLYKFIPSVQWRISIFILVPTGQFYTASETHVRIKIVPTLEINLLLVPLPYSSWLLLPHSLSFSHRRKLSPFWLVNSVWRSECLEGTRMPRDSRQRFSRRLTLITMLRGRELRTKQFLAGSLAVSFSWCSMDRCIDVLWQWWQWWWWWCSTCGIVTTLGSTGRVPRPEESHLSFLSTTIFTFSLILSQVYKRHLIN